MYTLSFIHSFIHSFISIITLINIKLCYFRLLHTMQRSLLNDVLDVGRNTLKNGGLFDGSFKHFGGMHLLHLTFKEREGRGRGRGRGEREERERRERGQKGECRTRGEGEAPHSYMSGYWFSVTLWCTFGCGFIYLGCGLAAVIINKKYTRPSFALVPAFTALYGVIVGFIIGGLAGMTPSLIPLSLLLCFIYPFFVMINKK